MCWATGCGIPLCTLLAVNFLQSHSFVLLQTSRSLPALVAPVLTPHLAAVTGLLKELFPSAAAMLSKSTDVGGEVAPSEAELSFYGDDSLAGVCHRHV